MTIQKKILGIIPARYASSRFPGKPLADIKGKSMIERVYIQAKKAKLLHDVIVATDDERIKHAVISFGGKVIMTKTNHQSGTDRCIEAVEKTKETWDVVINIQGDEPLIFPEQIDQLAKLFSNEEVNVATLIKVMENEIDVLNPNIVKAVINKNMDAMYFSRAPIPYNRQKIPLGSPGISFFKHIGIYGYTTDFLKKITTMSQSPLEITEALEQLRWLENGYKIRTALTEFENLAVDVPEDLKEIIHRLTE